MNTTKFDIQKALTDIALIRRTLNQTDQEQMDTKLVGVTLDANIILQALAFVTALTLFMVEIVSNNTIMQTLMAAGKVDDLRHFGIGLMGFTLAGLFITLYFVLWRASLHNGESMQSYISRNFKYVKNLSLISDVLMKFITISLLLLAGKAEWIAPVLMAFTGDYLLQGRLFTIPTKTSAVLGAVCLATAFVQFINDSHSLTLPLGVFTLIAGISMARLVIRYQQQKSISV
jgi:hypothetical protein